MESDPKDIEPPQYDPKYVLRHREELGYAESLLIFRYGGKFVRNPNLNYVGGQRKVISVGAEKLTFRELNRILREDIGVKKFDKIQCQILNQGTEFESQMRLVWNEESCEKHCYDVLSQGNMNYYIEYFGDNEVGDHNMAEVEVDYSADIDEAGGNVRAADVAENSARAEVAGNYARADVAEKVGKINKCKARGKGLGRKAKGTTVAKKNCKRRAVALENGKRASKRNVDRERGEEDSDSDSDVGIDEAVLIDVPDLTDNDDEEIIAVRKKYKEVIQDYKKKKGNSGSESVWDPDLFGVRQFSSAGLGESGGLCSDAGLDASGGDGQSGLCDIPIRLEDKDSESNDEDSESDDDDGCGQIGPGLLEGQFEDDDDLSHVTSSGDSEGGTIRWKRSRTVYFDPTADDPQFAVGMVFTEKQEIITALEKHCIKKRREIESVKSDRKRVRAKCTDTDCAWVFHCSKQKSTGFWRIKTLVADHTCHQAFKNKKINSRVLADHFIRSLGDIAMKLDKNLIISRSRSETGLEVTRSQARRVLERIQKHFIGDGKNEYNLLPDYAIQLKQSNPGTTVELWCPRPNIEANQVFKGIYICFDALKKGFKAGCRRVIGLDGCFLKGKYKGEILCAMGRDANDQMFPLAWAVVVRENYETWSWFLRWLMADLDIEEGTGRNWTLMTDQQKGLDKAIMELMPVAEHRFCARHIFSNWRKMHKGGELHKKFWTCARSTTIADLKETLANISGKAKTDLEKTPMFAWCRAHFDTVNKTDCYENNMCEVFNGNMLGLRFKAIYTLLEDIRLLVMSRIVQRRDFCEKNFKGSYGDRIWPKISKAADGSGDCHIVHGGEGNYEVLSLGDRFVVNLDRRTCTCRVWNLTGLPCKHVYRIMVHRKEKLEHYVDACYLRSTFLKSYQYSIKPVEGERFWEKTFTGVIEPPEVRKKNPGRRKNKRVPEEWEASRTTTKYTRKGVKVTCKECAKTGHNSRTCPLKKAKDDRSKENGGAATHTYFSEQRGQFVIAPISDHSQCASAAVTVTSEPVQKEPSQSLREHVPTASTTAPANRTQTCWLGKRQREASESSRKIAKGAVQSNTQKSGDISHISTQESAARFHPTV